jgi:hypothetical protein
MKRNTILRIFEVIILGGWAIALLAPLLLSSE